MAAAQTHTHTIRAHPSPLRPTERKVNGEHNQSCAWTGLLLVVLVTAQEMGRGVGGHTCGLDGVQGDQSITCSLSHQKLHR